MKSDKGKCSTANKKPFTSKHQILIISVIQWYNFNCYWNQSN